MRNNQDNPQSPGAQPAGKSLGMGGEAVENFHAQQQDELRGRTPADAGSQQNTAATGRGDAGDGADRAGSEPLGRLREHVPSYGGMGGVPRVSSDQREPAELEVEVDAAVHALDDAHDIGHAVARRHEVEHPHRAAGDLVGRVAGEHLGERALARAVRPHDGVHLAGVHGEGDPVEDLLVGDGGREVLDVEHGETRFSAVGGNGARRGGRRQPTDPSSVMPSSCCASSANSIGSSWKTSLQKPLTIIDTACSPESPRCLR